MRPNPGRQTPSPKPQTPTCQSPARALLGRRPPAHGLAISHTQYIPAGKSQQLFSSFFAACRRRREASIFVLRPPLIGSNVTLASRWPPNSGRAGCGQSGSDRRPNFDRNKRSKVPGFPITPQLPGRKSLGDGGSTALQPSRQFLLPACRAAAQADATLGCPRGRHFVAWLLP